LFNFYVNLKNVCGLLVLSLSVTPKTFAELPASLILDLLGYICIFGIWLLSIREKSAVLKLAFKSYGVLAFRLARWTFSE